MTNESSSQVLTDRILRFNDYGRGRVFLILFVSLTLSIGGLHVSKSQSYAFPLLEEHMLSNSARYRYISTDCQHIREYFRSQIENNMKKVELYVTRIRSHFSRCVDS